MRAVLLTLALAVCATTARAQAIVPILVADEGIELEGAGFGRSAWLDADGDGDFEIVLSGYSVARGRPITEFYENRNGSLEPIDAPLDAVQFGGAAWGDMDGDGDLDAFVMGNGADTRPVAHVYRNDGGSSFSLLETGIPGLSGGSAEWGDYDNDGDMDLAVTGFSFLGPITRVFRNDGPDGLVDINAGLPGASFGTIAWGDYDNDLDQDLLLTGNTRYGPSSMLFRNDGGGEFDEVVGVGLTGVTAGSGTFADVDSDGDLDITITGATASMESVTRVYRNEGTDRFTSVDYDLPGITDGGASWADVNSDGVLDLILYGRSTRNTCETSVFLAEDDTLAEWPLDLPGTYGGSVSVADEDEDGDLDFLLVGNGCDETVLAKVYRNQSVGADNPSPRPPIQLEAISVEDGVELRWRGAVDRGETPTPPEGLSYLLRIGSAPGASDVLRPVLGPEGGLLITERAGLINGQAVRRQLPPGTYYWSVHAVDGGMAVSGASIEDRFSVSPSLPTSGEAAMELPMSTVLHQNYPNPFNPSTHIRYELSEAGIVQLSVHDLTGRLVSMLHNGFLPAGTHEVSFDAAGLSSGVYVYRLQTGSAIITRYLTLQR